ncbi:hypothetical protein N0M98_32660 [Paenibacillus doosanensis]|uniref:Uncharacterized protein n=1 Tax=Paenibacillus konkukensis TaxID=2020716 RepID=A0ABY4RP58_9BACL|nr:MULTISPECIES: hypothetical protein [Paenibacillus]MCS7464836.1 hypothetical protein [Paenibacillus doosanensis]UQZ83368.1 hypothetical protein SK3146_02555 [Paenibacillus konkukensis]
MSKVFVEYQILPDYRPNYSKWLKDVRANYPEVEFYEGTDQPGVIVEIWSGMTEEEFRAMKQVRARSEQDAAALPEGGRFAVTAWSELEQWVKGGAAKVHIWQFEKVK